VELYAQRHYAVGTTTAVLSLGWYLGNIRGSREAAEAFNLRVRRRWVEAALSTLRPDSRALYR